MARRRLTQVPDDELRDAVTASVSLRGTILALELHDHTKTYKGLRKRIALLGIDTSHFRGAGRRPRSYSPEELRAAIASSRSIRQALLKLGVKGEGGNYKTIHRDISELNIDISHMTGRGWRLGDSRPVTPPRAISELLVPGSMVSGYQLKKRLLREGMLEAVCQTCGLRTWRGHPLALELDHVNGVNSDNRIENLRLLCPNCHSQTPTYRGRNRGRSRSLAPQQLGML